MASTSKLSVTSSKGQAVASASSDPVTTPRKQKLVTFKPRDDINLLKEVIAADLNYDIATSNVAKFMKCEVSRRTVKERAERLVKQFRRDDLVNLSRSGTEEEVTEKMALLQEISDMTREKESANSVTNDRKKKNDEDRRKQGEALREVAMNRKRPAAASCSNELDTSENESDEGTAATAATTKKKKVTAGSFFQLIESNQKRLESTRMEEIQLRREELQVQKDQLQANVEERKMMLEVLTKALNKLQ